MADIKVMKLVMDNFYVRLEESKQYSQERGGHGIIGDDSWQSIVGHVIDDYEKLMVGKPIHTLKRVEPSPKGKYVNSPQWN